MTDLTRHTVGTPLGMFGVWVADETVHAAGFIAVSDKSALDNLPGVGVTHDAGSAAHPALDTVLAYFAGEIDALDRVALALRPSPPFREAARAALTRVAPSTTITYTELAARAGNPRAIRAAASACATNPIALFIPCHRVLRSDGTLGGYLYGLPVKRALIEHELKYAAA
jgi:methylated-DNA-[protein]-cysteine S-methyltransferase